jgi:uncharacterized membrane protein YeaQ/YmgE (transglycosylase-associated protein family)
MRATDPFIAFVVVIVIGIAAGLIYDRVAGPGWLGRQIAGSRRGMVTSTLIGIAGSFIGFHIFSLLNLALGGLGPYVGAAIGAVVILWFWRVMR